ncbi:FCD domain-containing protein [Ramlibacter sp. AN1015]|uniref:GntR family transcriptional regulator n=1 Tax=Ramlibacter sp. AN1015 TaxID=3133428 RepID=UPI0030BD3EE7
MSTLPDSPPPRKTVRTSDLAPRIAEDLKRLIYEGEFAPGDRLNEAALALRMGTSRGPIREAVRVLTGWGLVTSVPNRGVFVRKLSVREMLEVYELRAVLFGYGAEMAAERANEADKRGLEQLLDEMEEASTRGDGTRYYEVNLRFHSTIMDLSGNRRARQAYDEYVKELHVFRRRYFNGPGNMRVSNEQHRHLVQAIVKGLGGRARTLAERHVLAGRQRLLGSLDDESIG